MKVTLPDAALVAGRKATKCWKKLQIRPRENFSGRYRVDTLFLPKATGRERSRGEVLTFLPFDRWEREGGNRDFLQCTFFGVARSRYQMLFCLVYGRYCSIA